MLQVRIIPAFIEWDVTSGEGPILHPPPVLPLQLTRPSRAGAVRCVPVWGLTACHAVTVPVFQARLLVTCLQSTRDGCRAVTSVRLWLWTATINHFFTPLQRRWRGQRRRC